MNTTTIDEVLTWATTEARSADWNQRLVKRIKANDKEWGQCVLNLMAGVRAESAMNAASTRVPRFVAERAPSRQIVAELLMMWCNATVQAPDLRDAVDAMRAERGLTHR